MTDARRGVYSGVYPDFKQMTLAEIQPYLVLGDADEAAIAGCAYNELLAGRGGDAVAALAGASGLHWHDLEQLVSEALAEVGLKPMSDRAAVIRVARDVLTEIATGRADPVEGALTIHYLDSDGDIPELESPTFSGLESELDDVLRWQREGTYYGGDPEERVGEIRSDIVALAGTVLQRLQRLIEAAP